MRGSRSLSVGVLQTLVLRGDGADGDIKDRPREMYFARVLAFRPCLAADGSAVIISTPCGTLLSHDNHSATQNSMPSVAPGGGCHAAP